MKDLQRYYIVLVDSATYNRQLFQPSLYVIISMHSAALVERAPSLSPYPTQAHNFVYLSRKRSNEAPRRVARYYTFFSVVNPS